MQRRSRKSLFRQRVPSALFMALCFLILSTCTNTTYVPYKPVYAVREGVDIYDQPVFIDGFAISNVPLTPGFRENIKLVLRFYNVPFKESSYGEILIPKQVMDDLDTVWNYTTKARDRKEMRWMITPGDEKAMQQALLAYLKEHPESVAPAEIQRLAGSEPLTDTDGNLRIGGWLLEFRDEGPALVRRDNADPAVTYMTVAVLQQISQKQWRVKRMFHEQPAGGD